MQVVREIEWLTLDEAAAAAGRSYSWARGRAATGVFHTQREIGGTRILVSAVSLTDELQRELKKNGLRKFAKRAKKRPHLRLVVNNTAK